MGGTRSSRGIFGNKVVRACGQRAPAQRVSVLMGDHHLVTGWVVRANHAHGRYAIHVLELQIHGDQIRPVSAANLDCFLAAGTVTQLIAQLMEQLAQ
jgi:hypothetical protein